MLASIADGTTVIEGFLAGDDCISTINCMRQLGIDIEIEGTSVKVEGKGLYGLKAPGEILDVGNSGTTIRLLSGILAAQPFETKITGDKSIQNRPMQRIIEPLTQMGAQINSNEGKAPLTIVGNPSIKAINYDLQIASAQIKSCILLAGLYADGETTVREPIKSRDHTEIMLKHLLTNVKSKGLSASVKGGKVFKARNIRIVGDISSAAFLIAAALILEDSEIIITNVGVNLSRTGIITVLREMGVEIEVLNKRVMCGEYIADIKIRSSQLYGTEIGGAIIPRLIDEIPIIAVCALFAKGRTVVQDAAELRVKESNRIDALARELGKMGAKIETTEDGFIIEGGQELTGASVSSCGDHRIAMALAVAGLKADGETQIEGGECASVSFPGFYQILGVLND
jgi:3-phosphoshikimate 1-carboxyvinyltransferase